ncbi:transposase [Anaerobacillus alkaliphilus]|uniref:Transposase n=1 Tax=Anaerobacillus alkaliphilus TaxID=1548597 RepID=A0A4Q0VTU2_9BACI|nr:transposase [Anaerobacillus alkaliphilus]RXJ00291.1 transposase [Anaerobacillus alkaliphilus]RXJ01718.1 transposase [Anaerobacillus alkaliphilus]RXJ02815.1 transposase [Anaerobacillus alkaliphilus]
MGKHYDQEYKDYVAKLIVEEGRKIRELSYELEISHSTVGNWVRDFKQRRNTSSSKEEYITPKELEKLKKQHEAELQKLKEENEILKKAMHIFTKNPM